MVPEAEDLDEPAWAESERLIADAGRVPIERDTLYNVVRVPVVA